MTLRRFIDKILSAQPDPVAHEDSPGLLDPLTAREEEIVRLLATELSAKGIADYLVVSVATVRAHIRSIYSKMDVHGRAEAVQRAKDLGILT
jgi:LuxR family maltose regulon positive regulatory protein